MTDYKSTKDTNRPAMPYSKLRDDGFWADRPTRFVYLLTKDEATLLAETVIANGGSAYRSYDRNMTDRPGSIGQGSYNARYHWSVAIDLNGVR